LFVAQQREAVASLVLVFVKANHNELYHAPILGFRPPRVEPNFYIVCSGNING